MLLSEDPEDVPEVVQLGNGGGYHALAEVALNFDEVKSKEFRKDATCHEWKRKNFRLMLE